MSEKGFISLIAVGALSFAALVCAPNALRLRKLGGRVKDLRRRAQALEEERAGLLESVSALKRGDDFAWETQVRHRLGWVRPGEVELGGRTW